MACGPLSLGLVLEEPVVDSAELFYRDSCGSFTSDVVRKMLVCKACVLLNFFRSVKGSQRRRK